MTDDYIYVIIGDDGYGMAVKLGKAKKIYQRMRNPFVKKFNDAMAGYVWLSSQINDYNDEYYNSSRILEQDDLVSLDDLIRRQYVVLPEHEVRKRDANKNRKAGGILRIGLGEAATTDKGHAISSFGYKEDDALTEIANMAQGILARVKRQD